MLVAIVTFSNQAELIHKVLQQTMFSDKEDEHSNDFVELIPIEGGFFSDFRTAGKQVCLFISMLSIPSHEVPFFLYIINIDFHNNIHLNFDHDS